ncbi:MAG: hypothetical protein ACR2FG_08835 [Marmoricola sp.]
MAGTENDEPQDKYTKLPEPIRFEDMRTSQDAGSHPGDGSDDLHERAWMLRTAGLA